MIHWDWVWTITVATGISVPVGTIAFALLYEAAEMADLLYTKWKYRNEK